MLSPAEFISLIAFQRWQARHMDLDVEKIRQTVVHELRNLPYGFRLRSALGTPYLVQVDLDYHTESPDLALPLRLGVPRGYPVTPPSVWSLNRRFPRVEDRHIQPDGEWCLWLQGLHRRDYDFRMGLKGLLHGAVRSFVIAQLAYEETGTWIWGDWGHHGRAFEQFILEEFSPATREEAKGLACAIARGVGFARERHRCIENHKAFYSRNAKKVDHIRRHHAATCRGIARHLDELFVVGARSPAC